MTIFAAIYTDEDVAGLVAILLKVRGIDVTTTPEQEKLGASDYEQLVYATSLNRCLLTHNRVDYEALHLQFVSEDKQHSGIMVAPRKNSYEVAQRAMILLDGLTADKITNQLLYI